MSDEHFLNLIADVWIENGGDAESLLWTYDKLYKVLK